MNPLAPRHRRKYESVTESNVHNVNTGMDKMTLTQTRSFLVKIAAVGATAVMIAIVSAANPAEVAAQCSGCRWTGSGNICGDPDTVDEDKCDGAGAGFCSPCGWAYAAVPAHLTPDGALYTPATDTFDELAQAGEFLSDGVNVLRNACSGAIIGRHYTDETAERARRMTARLVFE